VSWHEGSLAALDLEAAGVDPRTARIIEVGLFRFELDGSSERFVEALIDPAVPIPESVARGSLDRSAQLVEKFVQYLYRQGRCLTPPVSEEWPTGKV